MLHIRKLRQREIEERDPNYTATERQSQVETITVWLRVCALHHCAIASMLLLSWCISFNIQDFSALDLNNMFT